VISLTQFKITDNVPGKGFRHDGKVYRAGDLVDLPDSFPAGLFDYLKPVLLDLTRFKREVPATVKPLMVIMAVRRIPQVQKAFRKLGFIDRVYFHNFTPAVVSGEINDWLGDHGSRYTHVMLSSDDINPTPEHIRQLIEDVTLYDLPVVAGFCNICLFDRQDSHGMVCGCCVDDKPHKQVNITLDPVDTRQIRRKSYTFVTTEWTQNHPGIYPVWFQGMACGLVSMDVYRKIPFRSWDDGQGGLMQDLAFAYDCAQNGITQFVDFRVGMRHYGTHHGKLFVGKKPTRVVFKKAKTH
jgi:hypothetical protein